MALSTPSAGTAARLTRAETGANMSPPAPSPTARCGGCARYRGNHRNGFRAVIRRTCQTGGARFRKSKPWLCYETGPIASPTYPRESGSKNAPSRFPSLPTSETGFTYGARIFEPDYSAASPFTTYDNGSVGYTVGELHARSYVRNVHPLICSYLHARF